MLNEDVKFSDLLEVSKELRNILDPRVDKIYAGDIYATIDIMAILTQQTNGTMQNVTKDELTCFLEVRILINNFWFLSLFTLSTEV